MKSLYRILFLAVCIVCAACLHLNGHHSAALLAEVLPMGPALSKEEIEGIVARSIAKKSAVETGRAVAAGGLMRGLLDKSKEAIDDLKRTLEFFQACANNDAAWLGRHENTYVEQYNKAYSEGNMTPYEQRAFHPNALAGNRFDYTSRILGPANEGTNSAGGYNVPIPFAAELMRNLGRYGFARRYLRPYSMSSWKENFAGLLTKPSVAVFAENAAITASKPSMDQLQLVLKKIAAIYAASNEYLEDANIEVLAFILEIFQEQFGIAEDQAAFQYDNTNWPGLLYYGGGTITNGIAANGAIAVSRANSATGGKTGFPQMSDAASTSDAWQDLMYMMQKQPSALYEGGSFFVDQNVAVAMLGMRDANNRFLADLDSGLSIEESGLEGQKQLKFRGYNMVVLPNNILLNANGSGVVYDASAHVSQPFTIFTNPYKAWSLMGTRGGFRVELSKDATADSVSAFTNDLTLWRMVERVAFGTGRPETMAVLRTDAS